MLTKQIEVGAVYGEIKPYDGSWLHDAVGLDVSTPERLLNAITFLQDMPHTCVVFGALSDAVLAVEAYDAKPARMRRIKRDDIDRRGRLWKATIIDAAKQWMAIDLDGLPMPHGIGGSLRTIATHARTRLPLEFRGAWCIVTATSAYGIDRKGVHLRFWFWLDRPLTCAEKTRWLDKQPFIDPAIYRSENQPIYTAGPVFLGDPLLDDPMFGVSRVITLDGEPCVTTPSAKMLNTPKTIPFIARAPRMQAAPGGDPIGLVLGAMQAIEVTPPGARHVVIMKQANELAHWVVLGVVNAEQALSSLIHSGTKPVAGAREITPQEVVRMWEHALRKKTAAHELEQSLRDVCYDNDGEE